MAFGVLWFSIIPKETNLCVYLLFLFFFLLSLTVNNSFIWIPDSMAAKMAGAVQVLKDDTVKRTPMARPSNGREGKPIRLLSNHFSVKLRGVDAVFYQYSVMNNFEILHLVRTSSIYSEITFGYIVGLHQI
jgi:hypothetical protein